MGVKIRPSMLIRTSVESWDVAHKSNLVGWGVDRLGPPTHHALTKSPGIVERLALIIRLLIMVGM